MTLTAPPMAPPHCPNPRCRFHCDPEGWRFVADGAFSRQHAPHRVQRFRCCQCGRRFSEQTFRTTYWLQRPELLAPIFQALEACSGYRQIARSLETSPQTIRTHAARLGRHCLLFHQLHRPQGVVTEPLALDTFVSFEYSQFHPTGYHVAAGRHSHFFHGFTVSELRRSGTMTDTQKERRARIEAEHGRPSPRATERDVRSLLATVVSEPQALALHTDEHADYPRAIRGLTHLQVDHRTISSRAARTPNNPLFPINLLDMLVRHSGANHKRETIAFSKRRQSAIERLWCFLTWRNYMKSFSERKRDDSPAMRLGLLEHRVSVRELLEKRLFPGRIPLPNAWQAHYSRDVTTREIPHCATHRLQYAF